MTYQKRTAKKRTAEKRTAEKRTAEPANESDGPQPLIRSIATGVPGLDAVLRGGFPEYSFNLIAGGPGAGKTTLAQQIVFRNATIERPALYFTVLGEPTLKMIRYQRQFSFFRPALVGSAVRFINLTEEVLQRDLAGVLERIVEEVEHATPALVVVDSFRTLGVLPPGADPVATMNLEHFAQRLALHLTTWEVTSFLIGEYDEPEHQNPIFTVADGIFWMSQALDRNSVVRKLQAIKVRGRSPMPGLHTFRITDHGLQVFPRTPQQHVRLPRRATRLPTGVPGLDAMTGGGYPVGDAVLLSGPAGSGKTTFATQFLADGLTRGEAGVAVVFEEYPEAYLERAKALDIDLAAMIERNKLAVIYLRPLDLSVDETLAEILDAVERVGATRVVIDSLSGFEVALAPTFREDFRESLYRLVGALTATGVTVVMTAEAPLGSPDAGVTNDRVSFITDDIIVQRYVEIAGELRPVLAVVKMRGSQHSRDYRAYEITARGAVVGERLNDYHGITSGIPDRQRRRRRPGYAGLTVREGTVLDTLIGMREASRATLATHAGLAPDALADALDRLIALDYVSRTGKIDQWMYRAVARVDGDSAEPAPPIRRT